jgi:predicted RNase H-like nuclease (RuvC/YqgF family)
VETIREATNRLDEMGMGACACLAEDALDALVAEVGRLTERADGLARLNASNANVADRAIDNYRNRIAALESELAAKEARVDELKDKLVLARIEAGEAIDALSARAPVAGELGEAIARVR